MSLALSSQRMLDEHLQALSGGRFAVRPAKELMHAVDQVRRRYGQGQANLVTRDRVEAAVAAVSGGTAPGRRQLFVLAHALAQPVASLGGRCVLEVPLGERMLSHWEHAATAGQFAPSHWRGLFRSYMQVSAGAAVDRLRRLLTSSLNVIGANGRGEPSWLAGVRRHQGLLGDAAHAPYLQELLEGKTARLDDLRAEVDVPDASWFWAELRQGAIATISKKQMADVEFKGFVDHLLSLPEKIPNSRDGILAAVLDRYAKCSDPVRHPRLLEVALDAWGSPQLRSNGLWALVKDQTRQMACGWLAQEDLEDFYRLCQGTHQVDDRRLKFWLQFKQQMGYTQIVLGRQLRSSRDRDIREFIVKKRGRIGELTSGPASNNAILMQIGGWLFIEFSEKGNACYAFPVAEAEAVKLGASSYSLNQLKPTTVSQKRMIHMDGPQTWEQKFLGELRQVGIRPDDGQQVWNVTAPGPNAEAILQALRGLGVQVVDNRARGGFIWAFPMVGRSVHVGELKELGMEYSSHRGGYYLP